MLKFSIVFILSLIMVLPASARTWTSKDGERTFEGRFQSYEDGVVTVIRPDGRSLSFNEDVLSDEDRKWVAEQAEKEEKGQAVEHVIAKDIGDRLKVLNGRRLVDYEPKQSAEYYILLFSASWCPPCRSSAPGYVKFYNERLAGVQNVEMVLISRDRDNRSALDWAVSEEMPWPILQPSDYSRAKEVQKHAPRGIPTAVLVDAEGKELARGTLQACLAAVK